MDALLLLILLSLPCELSLKVILKTFQCRMLFISLDPFVMVYMLGMKFNYLLLLYCLHTYGRLDHSFRYYRDTVIYVHRHTRTLLPHQNIWLKLSGSFG